MRQSSGETWLLRCLHHRKSRKSIFNQHQYSHKSNIMNVSVLLLQVYKLNLNGTYQFRIKAENKYGISDGSDSEKVQLRDPFGLPGPPRNPKIIAATATTMTLTWDPPLDNGGATIQGYWLEKRERGAVYWGRVNRSPVTKPAVKGLQYTVLRLIEGTEYQFRIAACNAAGVGPPSEASECRFAVDPCSEFADLQLFMFFLSGFNCF